MPTPAPTGPALRITNLTTGYGKVRVLAGVQLDVLPGEAVALWGENGAGKTTLLKAVLGLLPHEGRVEILGADTKREPRAARGRIGYVPQEIQLEDARVGDVMRTYAALRGARRADAYGLLQRLGLGPHEHKRTSELSGGLRQRLGLALALLNNPAVLLLDEPTANLDAAARAEYIERLRELTRQGKAILFTSHRTDEVAALASRVAVLGSARQITLHTQRFLDANPEVITA